MLNRELFSKVKPLIESKLKDYPYYQMSIEMPGLGSAIPPNQIIYKSNSPSDPVAGEMVMLEYRRTVVNAVNFAYDKLDKDSKYIIDNAYFNNISSREEVIETLKISKNKYYKIKNNALYRFGVAFGLL